MVRLPQKFFRQPSHITKGFSTQVLLAKLSGNQVLLTKPFSTQALLWKKSLATTLVITLVPQSPCKMFESGGDGPRTQNHIICYKLQWPKVSDFPTTWLITIKSLYNGHRPYQFVAEMACRILFHQKKADLAFYKLKPSVSLKPSDPTKCFSTSPIWNTWLSTKWLLGNTDPKRHHFSTQSGGATPIFFTTWGPKTHFVQGGQPTTKGSGNGSGNANLHGIIGVSARCAVI